VKSEVCEALNGKTEMEKLRGGKSQKERRGSLLQEEKGTSYLPTEPAPLGHRPQPAILTGKSPNTDPKEEKETGAVLSGASLSRECSTGPRVNRKQPSKRGKKG